MEDSRPRLSSPSFLYGTAWKEERTKALVELAIAQGFRGIDTANQRRHYNEAAVGEVIRGKSLFIQTKFTYIESQDSRLPYDPNADYPTQVRQSFESSIQHLGHIDSYLLHGPRTRAGISRADREVWRTMEDLSVPMIGISNVTADQLSELCEIASIKPSFVQNRCFARMGWDRDVREVCKREGVVYQGFSLLTANVPELRTPAIREIAIAHRATAAQVIFAFALHVGMVCLTGTTNPQHMREDLAAEQLKLSEVEVTTIERISSS